MAVEGEILKLIRDKSGSSKVKPDTDIYKDLGMVGDDFHELIDQFAARFQIDMSGYLWYFHADEEGFGLSVGGLFFKPPYARVKRLPVTPALLTEMAAKKKWDLPYPGHRIPKKRYDILINQIVVGLVALFLVYYLVIRYLL